MWVHAPILTAEVGHPLSYVENNSCLPKIFAAFGPAALACWTPMRARNSHFTAVPVSPMRGGAGARFSRPPIARMHRLHAILEAGHFPNCRQLAQELEVSPKTVQRDIDFMRDQMEFPIEYNAAERGFFYTGRV